MNVLINVLNYNSYEKSRRCVESCLRQKSVEFDVLLIDNNSTDDSLEQLRNTFGKTISYLENGDNYGYAKGNNLGVEYAVERGYKYSLILNSDTELIGDKLLYSLLSVILSNSDCGVVAPLIYNVTHKGLVLNRNNSFYLRLLRMVKVLPQNHRIDKNIVMVSEAHGSALLVDNSLFMELGGFPEHFYMYCEESLFSKKVLWNGMHILWYRDKNNYVLHFHDKTSNPDKWIRYLMGRNLALEYLENKEKKTVLWSVVYRMYFIAYIIRFGHDMYIEGKNSAEELFKNRKDKSIIYLDGAKARERFEMI